MEKESKNLLNILVDALVAVFFVRKIIGIFKKEEKTVGENLKDFVKKEKKEFSKLGKRQESATEYCEHSYNIFREYFIPCNCNHHRPKILRRHSLLIITAVLLLLKFAMMFYLFAVYPNDGYMAEQMSDQMLTLVNESRAESKEQPLQNNDYLNSVALAKARDMLEKNYFAHQTPSGKMPWDLIDRDKYEYILIGENLAMDFTTADSAHKALMLSPSHRKNILNEKYSDVGIAVLSGKMNGQETNVMVEIFGFAVPKIDVAGNPESTTAGTTLVKNVTKRIVDSVPVEPAKLDKENSKQPAVLSATKQADEALPASSTEIYNVASGTVDLALASSTQATSSAVVAATNNQEPTPQMNASELNQNPIKYEKINEASNNDVSLALRLARYSKYFFYFVLLFLFVSLLASIFVKISIQHKPAIIETLISLSIIALLIYTQFSFLEKISDVVTIL